MRSRLHVASAALLCTLWSSGAAHAQTIAPGDVIVANDKLPVAIVPSTPINPKVCYLDWGGTIKVIGNKAPYPERAYSLPEPYVQAIFTPRVATPQNAGMAHAIPCQPSQVVWIAERVLVLMKQRSERQ